MKFLLLAFVSCFVFTFSVTAQTDSASVPKTIAGGVINGKAKNLVKPAYPPAALAVKASGAVNVQVTIDENGDVISAAAVSGHPLLRQAAVAAAQQSKFSPTILSGQPVRVTGIIVYNFTAADSGWFKVGYDLANLEKVPTLRYFNTNSIDSVLKPDWSAEREQIKRLETIKQTEESTYSDTKVSGDSKVSEKTEQTADGRTVKKIIIERNIETSGQPNAEQVAISQSLISSLQGRLAADQTAVWKFNLGVAVSRALSAVKNPNEKENTLSALRQQIAAAPADTSPEYLENARKIADLLGTPNPADETRGQIAQLMLMLFRN